MFRECYSISLTVTLANNNLFANVTVRKAIYKEDMCIICNQKTSVYTSPKLV